VLDAPKSDDWVDDYEVHDEPPVHDKRRQGKHRRRIDLKLASRVVRPRLRFCFEAKLLGPKNSVGKYLGADGLGRFVDGSYAANQIIGGMLGYVQSDDCDSWAAKLSKSLDRVRHKMTEHGDWTPSILVENLNHTFRTKHRRRRNLPSIEILHSLLSFT
jgi:hypothetical protein